MLIFRALVRLALFRNSGYKMLLHGGETPNVEKGSGALNSQNGFGHLAKPGWQPGPGNLKNYHEKNSWNLEGRAMSALSRFGENARMASEPTWLHRVQHQHALMEPPRNCSSTTYYLVKIINHVYGIIFC